MSGATSTLESGTVVENRAERSSLEGAPVSVIVPVTERPGSLVELYREYSAPLKSMNRDFEFVFAVESWGREMARPLKALMDEGEPIRVLEAGRRVGESMLLKAAAAASVGPILLTLPPYPRVVPGALAELIRRVEEGVDLASARRHPRRDPWINRLQARVFHWLLGPGLGSAFKDVASGVRAMPKVILEEVPLYGDFFRFLPLLAEREGFRVEEVPVEQHARDLGRRLYHPGVYVRRMLDLVGLAFLVRFTRKPLRFFGLVGALLAFPGSVILSVVLIQRLAGAPAAGRPIMLLGVLLFVLGVQSLALGLIGEIIVHLHASDRPSYRLAGPRDGGHGSDR